MLTAVEDYPLVDGQGRRDTFPRPAADAAAERLAFALRSPTFRLRDLVRLNARAAAPLAAVSVPDIYERLDHLDADSFLRDINFPVAARHLAFEVFSRSFFAEPAELSAAELATMFHIYFLGSSEGLVFDVAERQLRCGAVESAARVPGVARRAVPHRGFGHRGDHRAAASCALRLRRRLRMRRRGAGHRRGRACSASSTLRPGSETTDWRARIAALGTAPPFVVQRLWLDRPVERGPCAVPRDGRPATAGQCQRARALRAGSGRSGPRAHRRLGRRAAFLRRDRRQHDDLRRPAAAPDCTSSTRRPATREVVDERVLCRSDCPRFAPGDHAARPTVDHSASRRRCWPATASASTCPWR